MKLKSNPILSLLFVFILLIIPMGCSINSIPILSKTADQPGNEPIVEPEKKGAEEQIEDSINESIQAEPAQLVLGSNMKEQLTVTHHKGKTSRIITEEKSITYESNHPELATIVVNGVIHVSSEAVTGNDILITITYEGLVTEVTVNVKNLLEHTVAVNSSGIAVVTNPQALDVVVNKQRSLPTDFVPPQMVEPNVPFSFSGQSEKKLLQKVAADALEELFAAAKKDNITLYAVSGYRSYGTQKAIFNNNVIRQGEEEASRFSARPGHSEHQTGLTMDVTGTDSKCLLEQCFEHTSEGQWIDKHAAEYGFILRYPKDKEDITGYAFEPWHLRYVGKQLAEEINQLETTMEQYFSEAIPVTKP